MLWKPYDIIYHLKYLYERNPCTDKNNLKFHLFIEGFRDWWVVSTSWTFSHRWNMDIRPTPFPQIATITRTWLPCDYPHMEDDYMTIRTCEYKIMPLKTPSKVSTYICKDPPKYPKACPIYCVPSYHESLLYFYPSSFWWK